MLVLYLFFFLFCKISEYQKISVVRNVNQQINIEVTVQEKLGLPFYIEIRSFDFTIFWNLQVFLKSMKSAVFSKSTKSVVFKIWFFEIRKICGFRAKICWFSCQNLLILWILQSWGLGLSSSKVFQTKDQKVVTLSRYNVVEPPTVKGTRNIVGGAIFLGKWSFVMLT